MYLHRPPHWLISFLEPSSPHLPAWLAFLPPRSFPMICRYVRILLAAYLPMLQIKRMTWMLVRPWWACRSTGVPATWKRFGIFEMLVEIRIHDVVEMKGGDKSREKMLRGQWSLHPKGPRRRKRNKPIHPSTKPGAVLRYPTVTKPRTRREKAGRLLFGVFGISCLRMHSHL